MYMCYNCAPKILRILPKYYFEVKVSLLTLQQAESRYMSPISFASCTKIEDVCLQANLQVAELWHSHAQNTIFSIFDYRDKIKTEQIVKSLNLKISARDSRHTDSRVHLKALFDQWLPLSASLLAMVVDKLPSPQEMISERVEKLMCSGLRTFDSLPEETQSLKNGAFSRAF